MEIRAHPRPVSNPRAEVLQTALQFLRGVGPRKAADFARAGLHTIEDLLYRFPLRYEDRSRLQPIAGLRDGQRVTLAPAQGLDGSSRRSSP